MRNAAVAILALALTAASNAGFQVEEWRRPANEARAAYLQKDLQKAEELYQAALSEAEKLGPSHIAIAQVLDGLVVVLNTQYGPDNTFMANTLQAYSVLLAKCAATPKSRA